MARIKAKFVCTNVMDQPESEQKVVSFSPVVTGSVENESFAKYTPAGVLVLNVSYATPASDVFIEGQSYYVDITSID